MFHVSQSRHMETSHSVLLCCCAVNFHNIFSDSTEYRLYDISLSLSTFSKVYKLIRNKPFPLA